MDMFRYYMPTEVFYGKGIVKEKKELFRQMGSRAYIITYTIPGRHYALEDVKEVLEEYQIPYVVETGVEENPSTETVERAAAAVRDFAPDFIIGIGGGSPVDAAKAIGVLLANPQAKGKDLFEDSSLTSLPIIGIPTTAGTGQRSPTSPCSPATTRTPSRPSPPGSSHATPCWTPPISWRCPCA